ncbi:MAG: DNA repair protein RadC [Bacilli bacterium]
MENIDIVRIKMIKDKETEKKYKVKINHPWDCYKVLRDLLEDEDREYFLALTLNTKNEINNIITVSIGTLNSAIVHPREVFKSAILSNANKIIIAHNHPSGHIEPSQEDKNITDRLVKSGEILGIGVLDHIIIGEGCYFSFKENNIL